MSLALKTVLFAFGAKVGVVAASVRAVCCKSLATESWTRVPGEGTGKRAPNGVPSSALLVTLAVTP